MTLLGISREATEVARFVGASARESKAALITSFEDGEMLAQPDINARMLKVQGGRSELDVSSSYWAEICKPLAQERYGIFYQQPGQTIGFERIPHEYGLTEDGVFRAQAIAAHAIEWSGGTSLRLNVLGEPKISEPGAHEAPSMPLHVDVLTLLARHRKIMGESLQDQLDQAYGREVTPNHFLDRLAKIGVVDSVGIDHLDTMYSLRPRHRRAIRGLLSIIEQFLEDPEQFSEKGTLLREKLLKDREQMRRVIAKTKIDNQRLNGHRFNYSERLSHAKLTGIVGDTPVSAQTIALAIGIHTEDTNRMAKLYKHLQADPEIYSLPDSGGRKLYARKANTTSEDS